MTYQHYWHFKVALLALSATICWAMSSRGSCVSGRQALTQPSARLLCRAMASQPRERVLPSKLAEAPLLLFKQGCELVPA